jgi:hypothetical protein
MALTTDTLVRAETALIVARHYDPTVRTPEDAIAYWKARNRAHLHHAVDLIGGDPNRDHPTVEPLRDLSAIDTDLIRALEATIVYGDKLPRYRPSGPRDRPHGKT